MLKFLVILFTFSPLNPANSWYLTNPENNRQLRCPPKYVPIIDEYEKHFVIPLGGKKGSEHIFDLITTDFVSRGRLNGRGGLYHMHCAEFVKSDCHHCDPTKNVHENYCVHYIHPTKGKKQGCLARGVIPHY